MFKIREFLNFGISFLKYRKIESFVIDAELILANLLGKSRIDILMNQNLIFDQKLFSKYRELIFRRSDSEPISQIIGYREFWKDRFYVNKSTLIPRPETECLIEEVLKIYGNSKNLLFGDFGSGTGCIGLSLLKELKNSRCFLIEKSTNASKIIKKNAKSLNLSKKCILKNISWNDFQLNRRKKFDFIVSNPPYIPKDDKKILMRDVVHFEPKSALFANDFGLKSYHEIISLSKKYLKKDGFLFFEVDKNFNKIRIPFFLQLHSVTNDLLGIERVMVLRKVC